MKQMNSPTHRLGRANLQATSRAGFTLLEMVATLSTLLVLAVSAAGILGSVTEIGLDRRHRAEERAAVIRFAEIFRSDVGVSNQIVASDNEWSLRLLSKGRVVEYRWSASSRTLMRLASSVPEQDAARSPDVLGADKYKLSDRCAPEIEVDDDLVRVTLRAAVDSTPAWVVEAVR